MEFLINRMKNLLKPSYLHKKCINDPEDIDADSSFIPEVPEDH